MDAHDLKCLSGADALREARTFEDPIEFETPEEGSELEDDCDTLGLSLRRHPLALIRSKLAAMRIQTSEQLRAKAKDRQAVRASGIVTHHQRPSTANGVVFAALEDETGTVSGRACS